MTLQTLEELCEFITDGTHQTPEYCEDGGILFLSSKDVTSRKIDWDNAKRIPESLHEKLYSRLSPKRDDILLAKNGTTGVAAIVDRDDIFDVYVSLAVLRPKKTIYPPYLLHAINSASVKRQFDAGIKGIGVPNLHLSVIRKAVVNITTLEEQHEITNHLEAVSRIIEFRKKQLKTFDTLIKARFVEMFGDYHTNSKGFETHKGSELFRFSSGKFLPEEKRLESGIPVYGGNGIAWYTDTPLIDYPTIIIGRVGAQCGNIHTVTMPVWITDNAIYIKEMKTEKFTLEFLSEMMRIMDFYQYADFSGQPKITQNPLETLEYLTPPKVMQEAFTEFCSRVDKSKAVVQQALVKDQLLFDSLMQQYFG